MSMKIPFDDFDGPLEIVVDLAMVPPDKRAHKIDASLDNGIDEVASIPHASPTATYDPLTGELRNRLHGLAIDEALLAGLSARKLYALYSLVGGADAQLKQRFLTEVDRRRQTDPSNEYLQLLAIELRSS